MIIKRKHRDAYGNWVETPVRVDNPKTIKLYRKKAKERTLARMKYVSPNLSRSFDRTCTDNLPATTLLFPPVTASSMPSLNRNFVKSSPVSSVTKNVGCTASASRLAILPALPQQAARLRPQAHQAQAHLASPSLEAQPHLPALLRLLPSRARVAAKMARRANAPTVARWATSKPTESQYNSPNSFVVARSPISDLKRPKHRKRSLHPLVGTGKQPCLTRLSFVTLLRLWFLLPSFLPARLSLWESWACDWNSTSNQSSLSSPANIRVCNTITHPCACVQTQPSVIASLPQFHLSGCDTTCISSPLIVSESELQHAILKNR